MDNAHFEDKGLDPTSWHEYVCPECGFKKLVAEEYDSPSGVSYPANYIDGLCDKDGTGMDRV